MPQPAKEIRRQNFTAAVEAVGGVESFCRLHEMNPDYVRQLLRGGDVKSGRNIGDKAARTIEAKLGLAANALDHPRQRVAEPSRPYAAPKPELKERRLENDIDAIRLALGALMTGLALSRPDEAALVEDALQQAPEKFLDRGLLPELLQALGAGRRAATGRRGARTRAKPRSP